MTGRCDMCPRPATHGALCGTCAWREDIQIYVGDSE
jgi:hypothetical protein